MMQKAAHTSHDGICPAALLLIWTADRQRSDAFNQKGYVCGTVMQRLGKDGCKANGDACINSEYAAQFSTKISEVVISLFSNYTNSY